MPPQTTNQNPQPAQPATSMPPDNNMLTKKIKNAGQSTLVFGCFMVVISLIVLLSIKTVSQDARVGALIYFGVNFLASIFWVVTGLKIKKISNSVDALAVINQVVISVVAVLATSIIIKVAKSTGGIGLGPVLTLILGIYLLFVRTQIKKLK